MQYPLCRFLIGLVGFAGCLRSMATPDRSEIDAARVALAQAQELLESQYDYSGAVREFQRACQLYEQGQEGPVVGACLAHIGLAMAHLQMGQNLECNQSLDKAKEMILTDLALAGRSSMDTVAATQVPHLVLPMVAYLIGSGHRRHADYKASLQDYRKESDVHTKHLTACNARFLKALQIARLLPPVQQKDRFILRAQQGMGTVAESISTYYQAQRQSGVALAWQRHAITCFSNALNSSLMALDSSHPQIARNHHKLARNLDRLTMIDVTSSYLAPLVHHHYESARTLYDDTSINESHPKRVELEKDYNAYLQRQSHAQTFVRAHDTGFTAGGGLQDDCLFSQ